MCTPSLLIQHPTHSHSFRTFISFHLNVLLIWPCFISSSSFFFIFNFFLPFLCSEPKLCNLFRPLSAVAVAFIDGVLHIGVSKSICVKSPLEGALGTRGGFWSLEAVNHMWRRPRFLLKLRCEGGMLMPDIF